MSMNAPLSRVKTMARAKISMVTTRVIVRQDTPAPTVNMVRSKHRYVSVEYFYAKSVWVWIPQTFTYLQSTDFHECIHVWLFYVSASSNRYLGTADDANA